MTLEQSEKRFCETTKLSLDLTIFPFTKNTHKKQKQETIEELNKKFGFVPTPIFLVDTMIVMKQKNITKDSIATSQFPDSFFFAITFISLIIFFTS